MQAECLSEPQPTTGLSASILAPHDLFSTQKYGDSAKLEVRSWIPLLIPKFSSHTKNQRCAPTGCQSVPMLRPPVLYFRPHLSRLSQQPPLTHALLGTMADVVFLEPASTLLLRALMLVPLAICSAWIPPSPPSGFSNHQPPAQAFTWPLCNQALQRTVTGDSYFPEND